MATARKKTARKKTVRSKSPARKTATKKKAAKKPAAKSRTAPQASSDDVEVKSAGREASVEDRLLAPLAEIERLVGRLRQRDWMPSFSLDLPSWGDFQHAFDLRAPNVNLVNRATEIVLQAEIPGIDKEDLEVSVTDRSVTIKGQSRYEQASDEDEVYRREIRSGMFSRNVTLPEDVDGRKARASYRDGVLELRMPKKRAAKKHSVTVD